MAQPLAGKIALVTGASSGIGAATAVALAAAGATVALSARRKDRLDELVAQIEAAGGKALALPGDMTVEAEAIAAVEDTVKALGRIDILINSAGIMQAGGIEGADLDEYRKVVDINLMATVYTCKAAIPHMLAHGVGDIINISSLAGRKGGPETNAYSASKHAVKRHDQRHAAGTGRPQHPGQLPDARCHRDRSGAGDQQPGLARGDPEACDQGGRGQGLRDRRYSGLHAGHAAPCEHFRDIGATDH